MSCPTCGSLVRVRTEDPDGTRFYEPIVPSLVTAFADIELAAASGNFELVIARSREAIAIAAACARADALSATPDGAEALFRDTRAAPRDEFHDTWRSVFGVSRQEVGG